MRPLGWVTRRLGHHRWFASLMSRILPPIDRASYRLSGRRMLLASAAAPTLLLQTPGAAAVPLLYVEDGEGLVVAGTNWGKPHHPAWTGRLIRSATATVHLGRDSWEVVVHHLDPAQREAVWPRLLGVWPAFDTYRRRSGRDPRVFRLVRRATMEDR